MNRTCENCKNECKQSVNTQIVACKLYKQDHDCSKAPEDCFQMLCNARKQSLAEKGEKRLKTQNKGKSCMK